MSGDCDSPHPTSTTAAIVVSRRCFISILLLISGAGSATQVCREKMENNG